MRKRRWRRSVHLTAREDVFNTFQQTSAVLLLTALEASRGSRLLYALLSRRMVFCKPRWGFGCPRFSSRLAIGRKLSGADQAVAFRREACSNGHVCDADLDGVDVLLQLSGELALSRVVELSAGGCFPLDAAFLNLG